MRLHRYAVVGSLSAGLRPQVESALEVGPDIAVILIGGNDVTNRTPPGLAVRYLVEAVRALRDAGCEVVVGTCPDLGAIRPIQTAPIPTLNRKENLAYRGDGQAAQKAPPPAVFRSRGDSAAPPPPNSRVRV